MNAGACGCSSQAVGGHSDEECDCIGCAEGRAAEEAKVYAARGGLAVSPGGCACGGAGGGAPVGSAGTPRGATEAVPLGAPPRAPAISGTARATASPGDAARSKREPGELPRGKSCDCSFASPDGRKCGNGGATTDAEAWKYDETSKMCVSNVTCTYPCSNCYREGGSRDLVSTWQKADLKALCAPHGYERECADVSCSQNSATGRCECTLRCCELVDDGTKCFGRAEPCDPLNTMECRVMETLAACFGQNLCLAPCTADGTGDGGAVGACAPCRQFDAMLRTWETTTGNYDGPMQRLLGYE